MTKKQLPICYGKEKNFSIPDLTTYKIAKITSVTA